MERLIRVIALCAWLVPAASTSAEHSLPRRVRIELDRAYPGWRRAAVSPDVARLLRGHPASAFRVEGDFDGDGRHDFAVQILDPASGAAVRQRVVAALRRGGRSALFPLVSFPENRFTFLETEARGTQVVDRSLDPERGVTLALAHDALFIASDEKGGRTCVWTGKGFRCFVSSD